MCIFHAVLVFLMFNFPCLCTWNTVNHSQFTVTKHRMFAYISCCSLNFKYLLFIIQSTLHKLNPVGTGEIASTERKFNLYGIKNKWKWMRSCKDLWLRQLLDLHYWTLICKCDLGRGDCTCSSFVDLFKWCSYQGVLKAARYFHQRQMLINVKPNSNPITLTLILTWPWTKNPMIALTFCY